MSYMRCITSDDEKVIERLAFYNNKPAPIQAAVLPAGEHEEEQQDINIE